MTVTARLRRRLSTLSKRRRLVTLALFLLASVWMAIALPLAPQVAAASVNGSVGHGWVHATSPPSNVSVNLTANGYTPSTMNVPVGKSVSFDLVNTDSVAHTFTVYSAANKTLPWWNDTPANLSHTFSAPGSSLVNITLNPGANATWNATFAQPVSYEVLSLIPYQFQARYFGFINASAPISLIQFNVTAFDSLSFVPNTLSAPAGAEVDFNVYEAGHGHTFTLDGCSNDANITAGVALPTSDPCLSTGALVNLQLPNVNTYYNSGPVKLPSKPSTFWFVCTVPGHFAAGMNGHLYDGSTAVPATSLPAETSILQVGIIAVAAVAVGLSALLVLMGSSGDRPKVKSPLVPPSK